MTRNRFQIRENFPVQGMCRLISTADKSQKLNGLMVAGYHKGAFVTHDAGLARPIKTRQGTGEGEDALKEVLKHRIRPKSMEGEKPTPKLPSKLKTYAKDIRLSLSYKTVSGDSVSFQSTTIGPNGKKP